MVNNLYTLTLLKSFDILSCFESDTQEIGIKEIADQINMPQSSVYRVIQSLEFVGLIFQNRESKKYRMGAKLIELSRKCKSLNGYLNIAKKYMEDLGKETQETVNLAIPSCDKIIYIYKVESPHVLRPNFVLNSEYSACTTGLGKVLLSELSEASLRWVYNSNARDLKVSEEEFLEAIEQVRQNGYAYDDQEFSPGLRCVAAPIYGPGGKILFSMSVSAPVTRMEDETYRHVKELVIQYATRASEQIQSMG